MTADATGGRSRAARSKRRGRAGEGRLAVARKALTAWLSRPLASFHLVLALCGLLTVIGVVMVLSASSVNEVASGSSPYGVFGKHVMFVALGLVAFWVGLRMPLRVVREFSPAIMFAAVALLVIVLTPAGSEAYGSKGWIVLGPVQMQPVELAKVALALWGAHILVIKSRYSDSWRQLLVPLVPVALVMFALVMAQPDLGGTVSLAVVLIALLWFGNAPRGLFAAILAGGVAGMVLLALISAGAAGSGG